MKLWIPEPSHFLILAGMWGMVVGAFYLCLRRTTGSPFSRPFCSATLTPSTAVLRGFRGGSWKDGGSERGTRLAIGNVRSRTPAPDETDDVQRQLHAALHDPARLAAVRHTALLDTPPEPAFDRLTQIATQLVRTPVALVSLVDDRRQFFKSATGVEGSGTPLTHSFCKHVVASGAPLIVTDARQHGLVQGNPAIQEFGIAAYLGVPLITPDGSVVGTLCAIDHVPREWTADDVLHLGNLAEIALSEIALRAARSKTESSLAAVRESARFARSTVDALSARVCILDERGILIAVNRAWRQFAEAHPPIVTGHGLGAHYLAVCDAAVEETHATAMASGVRRVLAREAEEFALEYSCLASGVRRWFVARVTAFAGVGPRRLVIAHEDVTTRREAEDAAREASHKLIALSRAAGIA